ncbi:DinB family protein [Paenibacillus arenilitoris]|uniref:DinB family protein n=1 Tax=Paenibacillus arenilitoris TaxID=2772299 RepID=A0A927CKI7_9BACL|nr:DinB family protein [Paenibacillus arenilitoris]MBD2867355.1 DinB family protein [Paenibacillus arenilitoris]
MYEKLEQFASEWAQEAKLTEAVMNALTDEALSREVAPNRRTLGQIAWHLVASLHYMASLGLAFEGPPEGDEAPSSAAVIAERYRQTSESMLQAVMTQWDDASLRATAEIMGEQWANGASLRFTVMHQAHHRGQMTVLMRQAGITLPEVYGPTYESWIRQGMAPLK